MIPMTLNLFFSYSDWSSYYFHVRIYFWKIGRWQYCFEWWRSGIFKLIFSPYLNWSLVELFQALRRAVKVWWPLIKMKMHMMTFYIQIILMVIFFRIFGFDFFSRIWSKTGNRFPSHTWYKYQEAIAWSADGNRSRRSWRFYISWQFQTALQNLYQWWYRPSKLHCISITTYTFRINNQNYRRVIL